VSISFPSEGIGTAAEAIALLKGAKNPVQGKKLIDWATSPAMQGQFAKHQINFVPRTRTWRSKQASPSG
jgi:iron(III) transport system substrate-binding protein